MTANQQTVTDVPPALVAFIGIPYIVVTVHIISFTTGTLTGGRIDLVLFLLQHSMASSPLLHSSENGLLLRLEGILTSYSALKDLKTASSDEELAVVLDKFREEMNEKSKIVRGLKSYAPS